MATRAIRACGIAVLGVLCGLPASAAAQNSPFPNQSEFQKVLLNDRPGEPMSLAVLPDGRVLHTARTGEIRIHNPRNGLNTLVINMADTPQNPRGLYQHDEEGLQGIAIDPNFEENRWVYLYYSPRLNTPTDVVGTGINEGDAPETITTPEERARLALFAANEQTSYMLLSRFKFQNNRLNLSTEQEIIRVPVDRGLCCHVGGQIEFDYAGNLYLSTGDDTNPFQSSGYTPIDDRETRNPAFDARRTSGNTNDLRGKILRIRVNAGGGYSIPNGNMFGRCQAQTRPEIFAMGMRNPFRFAVNKKTGDVYVGDYSPDANMAESGARAGRPGPLDADPPAGQLRLAVLRHAGQAVRRLRLHARARRSRVRSSTASRRPTTRATTPACAGCRRSSGPRSGTATRRPTRACSPSCSTCAAATASGRWAARRTSSTRTTAPRPAGRACSTATRCSMSGRATTSRCSSSTARTAGSWPRCTTCSGAPRARCRTSSRTTRWTRSSARTARSTRWSTATGSSPSSRRRSCRGSTSCAAASTRRS